MRISSVMGSVEGFRRKLRGLAAVVEDPAATEHEKANAQAATARLRHRLKEAGRVQEIGRTTSFDSADGQRK
jgi:hypothetical protein